MVRRMTNRTALTLALLLAVPVLAEPVRAETAIAEDPPAVAVAATPDQLALAYVEPRPRPAETASTERHCTTDGAACISGATYLPDVCRTIEQAAGASGLDANFFARLIWRESLFDAAARSPAGAEGIAQFMPGTAKLRGLDQSFNPAAALSASAEYLADLARAYGNLGLAAAAYNGGESRVERFLANQGGLPLETRTYVHAITGHSAEAWRDAPPASVDLALDGSGDFQARCLALAATRGKRELDAEPPLPPWGVIIASSRSREAAARLAKHKQNRNASVLGGETIHYGRSRRPGMARSLYFAQLGRETRREADALCARLRKAGDDCMVLRN